MRFIDTCTFIEVNRNKYGDRTLESLESVPCLFREILSIDSRGHGEEGDADALIWVYDELSKGQVVLKNGVYYEVDRVVEGKPRLRSNDVQFYKGELRIMNIVS